MGFCGMPLFVGVEYSYLNYTIAVGFCLARSAMRLRFMARLSATSARGMSILAKCSLKRSRARYQA